MHSETHSITVGSIFLLMLQNKQKCCHLLRTVKTLSNSSLLPKAGLECTQKSCYLIYSTLGAHVQWGLQYLVCVSVCVSVTQHLTLHVIIRATSDSNVPSGGWRSKILNDFLWKCFVANLERFLLVRLRDELAIFYSAKNAHAYESGPRG